MGTGANPHHEVIMTRLVCAALVLLALASQCTPVTGDTSRLLPEYCKTLDHVVKSVDTHVGEWNATVSVLASKNCTTVVEFMYGTRARFVEELQFVMQNLTTRVQETAASPDHVTTNFLNFFSRISALLSGHLLVDTAILNSRPGCFDDRIRSILLLGIARMKEVVSGEVMTTWHIYAGDDLAFRAQFLQWVSNLGGLLVQEMESMRGVLQEWVAPVEEKGTIDAPLQYVESGAFITSENYRRTVFGQWIVDKGLLRTLIRHIFALDDTVADFGAGGGQYAHWLNDTGLVTAYAYDGTADVSAVTKGAVSYADLGSELQLGRQFDWVYSIEVAEHLPPSATLHYLANIDRHAKKGAVISWAPPSREHIGIGHLNPLPQDEWIALVEQHTGLRKDAALTAKLREGTTVDYIKETITAFKRVTVGGHGGEL
eukprot:GDKI01010571.1.p1 GENE.GDKI01010571.1~~GDKI01010571.1.p1  ORF type:complete len:429 (-),score=112.35 GDKI01010571.1:317-1603(-)